MVCGKRCKLPSIVPRINHTSANLGCLRHIAVIASLLHRDKINPVELRRNIVISGINLQALKNREFKIGTVILKMTGLCHSYSRLEEVFGEGGYNAVRGHGGIKARVILPGFIRLQDKVEVI